MKARSAYTLMEVILVMAILVAMAAFAFPVVTSMYSNSRLNAASDMIRARWTEARSRAIEERRPYRFAVKDNSGKFRVAPETAEFWDDAESGDNPDDDREALIVEGCLPDRVIFNEGSSTGGIGAEAQEWRKLVTFLPDGTAREDVEISFGTQGTRPLSLKLRSATGCAVSARKTPGEPAG